MGFCKIIKQGDKIRRADYDHVVVLAEKPKKKTDLPKQIPSDWRDLATGYVKAREKDWTDESPESFDLSPTLRFTFVTVDASADVFSKLRLMRKVCGAYGKAKKVLLDLSSLKDQTVWIDAACAAHAVAFDYEAPVVKSKPEPKHKIHLDILCQANTEQKEILKKTSLTSAGTNLMRQLFETPANILDCKALKIRAKKVATECSAAYHFIDKKKLADLGAFAFLAVARGSDHQDAGIAKLTYSPSKSGSKKIPHLVLVGKGVVYDTGGTNLKPAQYMFGMQGDMGGAAVALSLFRTIALLKLPIKTTCYLAISDNAIDAKAYRPNEVVKTVAGKTIETVHTDAEGRMMLVDTLSIATKEAYDLVMDFATLTGSCVRAIGTTYSGVFTNDSKLHEGLIAAGKRSGERLWPFPMDEDFFTPLKSKIADLKQCLLTGGVDHIEAAQLLKQFVNPDKPWIHMDLSSAENEGGLAHVPTKVTGFGVRVGLQIVEDFFAQGKAR